MDIGRPSSRHRTGEARNRDHEYSFDGLLRLLEAKRGEEPESGSFSLQSGSERFGYDFIGNFVEFDTDQTGNGAYTDSSDRTRDGTFNNVNEQTALAVTVGGSTTTYDVGSDAAGNIDAIDVSVSLGHELRLEHDAWGRLSKVDFFDGTSAHPRARYQYAGLGMRVLADRDSAPADSTHALDERRLLYYSPSWQLLEEHVDASSDFSGGDPSDTDRVVQTLWGARYVDDLVMRRQNNNHAGGADTDFTDTGDRAGDWALTDGQFSVVALVNSLARVVERVSYDSYGAARHHHARDVDGDGDVDSTDAGIASGLLGKRIYQTGYNADADFDRNGYIESTDVAAFGSTYWQTALSGGPISTVDNTIGFCGYVFCGETEFYSVRMRTYSPGAGFARWLERDPAGYVDGPGLYGYGPMSPVGGMDPSGMFFSARDYVEGWRASSEAVHVTLDGAGFFPGLGELADGANGLIYLFEGELVEAGISFAAAVPVLGEGGKLARLGAKAKRAAGAVKRGVRQAAAGLSRKGRELINAMRSGRRAGRMADLGTGAVKTVSSDFPLPILNPNLKLLGDACFLAGTLVWTAQGAVAIEELRAGDLVWSYDHAGETWSLAEVAEAFDRVYDGPLVEIVLAVDTGAMWWVDPTPLVATGEHPFWVIEGEGLDRRPAAGGVSPEEHAASTGGRWVDARWLRLGDRLLTRTGFSATVVGLTIRVERERVFNLAVREVARYAVDPAGVLVHNSVPCLVGGRITGYTWHGLHRAIDRDGVGVHPGAILDAVRNPIEIRARANATTLLLGDKAGVVLSSEGRVVTVWSRSRDAHRILRCPTP